METETNQLPILTIDFFIEKEEQNTNTTETVTLEEVKEEKAYSDIMSRYLKASSKLESEAF